MRAFLPQSVRLSFLIAIATAPVACSGGSGGSSGASPTPEASAALNTQAAASTAADAASPLAAATSPAVAVAAVSGAPIASTAALATATPAATVAPTATPAPTPSATRDPLAVVKFTDIHGIPAETAIKQEAALGIFGTTSGAFHPEAPVTRAEYITLLVTANNIYFKATPTKQIRLADHNSDQTFVDVPKNYAHFAQIEGLADSGYVIGIDKNHFAPTRSLTREELVALQVSRYMGGADLGKVDSADHMTCVNFADKARVSKPYWAAFSQDQCTGFAGQDDLHRIFGSFRTLHPQRPVTRADVAIALQKVAGATPADLLPH